MVWQTENLKEFSFVVLKQYTNKFVFYALAYTI